MKYLIRRATEYLHDYTVVPDNATDEFKRQINQDMYGTPDYVEVDESEMYSFGLLKSEKEDYINSPEYRGEFNNNAITNSNIILLK